MSGRTGDLPARRLAAYAGPALPLAALALPFYVVVPTFYGQVLGLPLAAVGAVLLAIRLIDAAADPLIGIMADRMAPEFGRRRELFLLSVPPVVLGAMMVFWPPAGAGIWHLALWGTVLSLGYTGITLAHTAWGAEMATDYQTRSRVSAAREVATLVGTLIAIALPFTIGVDRATGFHGLAALAVFVALALPLAAVIAVRMVPEPPDRSHTRLSLRDSLGALAANRPFRRLMLAYLLNGLANGIPATLFLAFVSERLEAPDWRGPLLFLYFLCGVLGVPLAVRVAARFGKHRSWCGAMLAACAVFAVAALLGPGDVAAFAVICAITGLLLGFDLVLPPAMQADVIDVDTARSGAQRSGLYFAAWALATKLALALAVGIAFPLLSLAGFEMEQGGTATPQGLTALGALYALAPIPPKLAAIALMWRFPLDRAAQDELRATIEAGIRR